MWPFSKKPQVLGRVVPSEPPVRVAEVREAYSKQFAGAMAFDGPFPLLTDKGIYMCKSCGVPFDNWNLSGAANALREAVLDPKSDVTMFMVTCRKCSARSVFSPKDVVTGHRGDATGPWTTQELGMAEMCLTFLFRMTPAEIKSVPAAHLHQVFFLYK